MAYTDIDKPDLYFNTVLYTGNGSTQSISGVNFKPDWLWIKSRGSTGNGRVHDVVRGVDKQLYTSLTNAEYTYSPNTGVTSFDSDGFSLGSDIGQNTNTETYVSWNWLASNTTASNTDGSITSTVSANTTSGFSIVSYTGTGANATVGHGLGVAPSMYIVKNRSDNDSWGVYHKSLGATKYLRLQGTDASATSSVWWNDTEPTSSVFSVGTAVATNSSSENLIAYCFAEKKGFSKFGSYTANGSSDNAFCFTGFKPSFVMIKCSSAGTTNWNMFDTKRDGYNGENENLSANLSASESAGNNRIDILSNGFKVRASTADVGSSGATYIYMCFAESPFTTSTGIPTTAR